MKYYGGVRVVKGISAYVLVVIWITMLTIQSEIRQLLKKFWVDFDFLKFQDTSVMIQRISN